MYCVCARYAMCTNIVAADAADDGSNSSKHSLGAGEVAESSHFDCTVAQWVQSGGQNLGKYRQVFYYKNILPKKNYLICLTRYMYTVHSVYQEYNKIMMKQFFFNIELFIVDFCSS